MAASRTIAIGDIHGCLAALETVLAAIAPRPEDTLILLGDYVDRGPDCRRTIERLLQLGQECRLVPLLGNHDEMLLQIHNGQSELLEDWLGFGGAATLQSYGAFGPADIPPEHMAFLHSCRLWHESARHFYVHASYRAEMPLDAQPREVLLWESLKTRLPGPHRSGKTAIVGHTSQKNCEILDLGYLKCIDTWCYGAGWLTALEVETGRIWQADKSGRPR
ncbi:MAG: metallophosphoesterase family protein [Thermoguttaceae bacterium]